MQELYLITVPGLEVRSDWRVVHDRLLDEFAEVTNVLATTVRGTILIVYEGSANPDAWLQTVSETILHFRHRTRPRRQAAPVRHLSPLSDNRAIS